MIRREVIDDILQRTDIESLVSSYVSIKRAGSNLKGLCPFHNEKSPSFTIFPSDNSFYCFGCGIGGNAITFIRQIEHLDYPDAIQFLAKRVGITVVDDNPAEAYQQKKVDKARLFKMNVDAAKFFHQRLFDDTPDAKAALKYFTETRRLSLATIKHFGLGYAPNSYDGFMQYMKRLGYTEEEMLECSLLGRSDKGRYYDFFRNRVMFPIIDPAGNVIAFGGRVMDDSKPKYRNSSDTPVFKKLRNLFALNFARHNSSEQIILCEGYMDVIALHAAGFTNAVATLGTAINDEQARLLSRYTKHVIICYDADEAGQKAASRALKMLSEVGVEVSVLRIPGAKDPDEYIKEFGKEKFAALIGGSKSKFEYNMDTILSKYNIQDQQDRISALAELVRMISTFHSSAERAVYIQEVSKKIGVPASVIKSDVERVSAQAFRKQTKEGFQQIRQKTQGYSDKVNLDFARAPLVARNEENVLGLLFLYENHRKRAFEGGMLSEEDFFTDLSKRMFRHIRQAYDALDDPNKELDSVFTPEEIGRIVKIKMARMQLTDNGDEVFDGAVDGLKSAMKKQSAEKTTTLDALASLIQGMRDDADTPEK